MHGTPDPEASPSPVDTPEWFGQVPAGCDVANWWPYMTADELGLDYPKRVIDFESGEIYISFPSTCPSAPDVRALMITDAT